MGEGDLPTSTYPMQVGLQIETAEPRAERERRSGAGSPRRHSEVEDACVDGAVQAGARAG